MPTFLYTAKQPNAKKEFKSEIEASSQQDAEKQIIKRGMIPVSVKLKGSRGRSGGIRGRIKTKDKILFSRQLSTLINAGLPLVQSLRTVSEQTQNKKMQLYIAKVTNDVEGGRTLSESMKKYPDIFNNVFTSLVGAGEVSGTLDETLERLANQQEKDAAITSKVKGALVYPAIVILVMVGVVVFMLTSILPQVELLYEDLDKELPFLTRIMLSIAGIITGFWWIVILVLIASIYLLRLFVKTPTGRSWWDSFKMKVPVFGKLMKKLYMARFARTSQTLMASAVPLLQALDIASLAVGNVVVKEAIQRAAEQVKSGKSLGTELAKEQDTFLPLVPQMISVGERSGNIDSMLGKAADYYENELDNEIKTISTTIEPILMVVLAVVAGGMVAAILLPVYSLVGESIG